MAQLEAEELRRTAQMSGNALAESMVARNEAAMREAKAKLKQAHEMGDTDALVDAQEMISRLSAEGLAIRSRMPRPVEERPQQPVQQIAPQQPQPAPQLAPNVAAWLAKNSWFAKPGSEAKTEMALSIHRALEARGIRPESPDYTRELDRGLKAVYSEHQPFEDTMSYEEEDAKPRREVRRPNATADASRDNGVSAPSVDKRKVTLTRSELLIAKKLGVSPQAYAAQKLRMSGGRGAQ